MTLATANSESAVASVRELLDGMRLRPVVLASWKKRSPKSAIHLQPSRMAARTHSLQCQECGL